LPSLCHRGLVGDGQHPHPAAKHPQGAALATVVGVLIEVSVMLSVVQIVNRTQDWYEMRNGT